MLCGRSLRLADINANHKFILQDHADLFSLLLGGSCELIQDRG